MSLFDRIPEVVPDGAFAMIEACRADPSEKKVNLSPGIYRDENAKTWVLPSVKKVLINQLLFPTSIYVGVRWTNTELISGQRNPQRRPNPQP